MILIAHRGNTDGPNPEMENRPVYVQWALENGYDVEIDLWYVQGQLFLGHDEPQYEIEPEFLHNRGLWIHCKDFVTLQHVMQTEQLFANCFYHTDEDYVLTRHGFIWAYPGNPGGSTSICVMPELSNQSVEGFAGVCSDFVEKYK